MNPSVLLLITFIVLLVVNVPIAISIGLSIMVYGMVTGNITMTFLAKNMYTTCDSFPLMAVPFFILAGALMEGGGLSKRLVNFADSLVGHFTGGLAIVTIITCMFFGAISGSSPATVAAVGAILIPSMLERGYERSFSVALVAASGMLGIIVPPSIPMVMYGIANNASIGGVFLGGIGAAVVCALALIVVAVAICHKRGFKGNGEKFSIKKVGKSFIDAIGALMVPVIILGGIYGGLFTPTEAAAVAVVYALIAGCLVYKELTWKGLFNSISSSTVTVGSILIVVSTATTLSKIFTIEQVPQQLAGLIGSISSNIYVIMLIINILLLIVGCVMETAAAILILAPILYPIVQPFGIEPIHFGVMMVVNLGIGMLTPPVGVNLFVATGIGKVQFASLVKAIVPFIVALLAALILTTVLPEVTMLLPNILGY